MARKILLADDSVTAQNMGRKILADAGYEVITVNNGSAALKKIADLKPDLIVLDVYMPGYSGLEVCQRLKEARETAKIPVLLTVGKLEPFKPEEAKRARADGFIVKPFEASELLSALAKMEDRIVPKSEPSKPGRFARAIAAVEEGPGIHETAASEEETGWKNRIAFPTKKPKVEEPETEDPAIYNPVNRDLRTVLDQATKESAPTAELSVNPPAPAAPEESQVDVTAVASMGLPKDVTPEEIAALAAAVAQVQAKVSAAQNIAVPENPGSADRKVEAQSTKVDEVKAPEAEAKTETLPEAKTATAEASLAATFASQPVEADKAGSKESPLGISHADAIAAIAALEPSDGKSWGLSPDAHQSSDAHSAGEPKTTDTHSPEADAPATMAATAASAGSGSNGSSSAGRRWAAVPVALDHDEASISLENEMQKAYAAFAAAEANLPGFVGSAATTQTSSPSSSQASSSPASEQASAATDSSLTAVAIAEPVVSQTFAPEFSQPVAAAMAETPSAETQPVVTSEPALQTTAPAETGPCAEETSQPSATSASEVVASVSSTAIQPSVSAADQVSADQISTGQVSVNQVSADPNPAEQSPTHEEAKLAETAGQAEQSTAAQIEEAVQKEASKIVEAAVTAVAKEFSVVAGRKQSGAEAGAEASVITENAVAVAESKSAGGADMGEHRESEAAAAWASWRQIRETGDKGKSSASKANNDDEDDDDTAASQPAAMAVAAGAEKSAEKHPDVPAGSADAIASIVDSVLADLRPKIVEEISKKLGEKK